MNKTSENIRQSNPASPGNIVDNSERIIAILYGIQKRRYKNMTREETVNYRRDTDENLLLKKNNLEKTLYILDKKVILDIDDSQGFIIKLREKYGLTDTRKALEDILNTFVGNFRLTNETLRELPCEKKEKILQAWNPKWKNFFYSQRKGGQDTSTSLYRSAKEMSQDDSDEGKYMHYILISSDGKNYIGKGSFLNKIGIITNGVSGIKGSLVGLGFSESEAQNMVDEDVRKNRQIIKNQSAYKISHPQVDTPKNIESIVENNYDVFETLIVLQLEEKGLDEKSITLLQLFYKGITLGDLLEISKKEELLVDIFRFGKTTKPFNDKISKTELINLQKEFEKKFRNFSEELFKKSTAGKELFGNEIDESV